MVDPNTNRNWWCELFSDKGFFAVTGVSALDQVVFHDAIGENLFERISTFCRDWLHYLVPRRPKPDDNDDLVNVWIQMYTRMARKDLPSTLDDLFVAMTNDYGKQAKMMETWSAHELETRSSAFSTQYPGKVIINWAMPLFLPAQFPGMDIAIPIHIRKTGALAVLLVQVKNRHGDSPTPGLRIEMAEDLDKATRKLGTDQLHSVIGLAMCLRCSEYSDPNVDIIQPTQRRSPRPRNAIASSSLAQPSASAEAATKAHLLAIVFGLWGVYSCLEEPTRGPGMAEEKSAAAKEKERDSMDRVCGLFEELLGKWPDFYRDEDVGSAYVRKLLDPFCAKHANEGDRDDAEDDKQGKGKGVARGAKTTRSA